MSDEMLQLYVLEQLKSFYSGNRCCMKFLAQLFRIDPRYFVKTVKDFGLRMRSDLDESVIVFKDNCHHAMEAMDLRLCQESVKDMYMFHRESEFCGSHQEFQASPDFLSPGNAPPTVPPHRFSLGPLKQSMARNNQQGQESFQATCAMQPYKDMILQGLSRSRVLVINGGTFCKSTAIPMYIIEKCSEERRHCKIICVEREQLVAIHNSECLAGHFHEKVGETVAYQVQLQSRISDSSNLVYTTSSFLLRVLMGQSTMDSFRHISHVVIVGAHQHEAFADLLLRELNVALRYHPYLKVILLSNYSRNYEFLEYFGEGEEINLDGSPHDMEKFEVVYLDDIHKVLTESRPSTTIARAFNSLPIALSSAKTAGININHLDRCLEAYERSSNDEHFNTFMYMVKGEAADINHRHSITGRTALNIASLLGKVDHVKTLLQLNADPLITDKFDVDALKGAFSMENLECFELLKVACFENTPRTADWRQDFVNHGLITDIIHMLTTKNDIWKRGNVVVCLPSYQHLVQLNYALLKQKLLGNLPEQIDIFMLYNQAEKTLLEAIITPNPCVIKIILSTDIAETLMCFENILYVIDAARQYRCTFDNTAQCKRNIYEWSSKQSLENRRLLLNPSEGGVCFRLIPEELYHQLPEVQTPDLLTIPLDRVCLSVKLLSQHTMVSEYLQETIVKPPFIHIYRAVENLKKISVFTDLEDITWLGCRLIDVPVECHLGKLLVFAILLQCLDPILTIVSFITTLDPFELDNYRDDLTEPYLDILRSKIKDERKRFSEGLFSDHLMFLRLYQEWQNELRGDNCDSIPNKYNFMLNGLLEHICNVRTQLVGALRSSQLIHNKGSLSMHYINLKSNCWPIIKAALAGGLYPSICLLDRKCNRLKSPVKEEIVLHPNSVLRDLNLDSLKCMDYISPWILYGNTSRSWHCNSIACNTIVAAISVALFAGPTKISSSNVQITSISADGSQCYLHIDEWISFKLDYSEALLLLKTRQHFYSIYVNYLQRCGLLEKFKRPNCSAGQNNLLFDCIEKILVQEDLANGFMQPERIGLRPKAVPNKLMMCLNVGMMTMTTTPGLYRTHLNLNANATVATNFQTRTKQYFMVYRQDVDDDFHNPSSYRNSEWFHVLTTLLDPKIESTKLTFFIFYTRHPDLLRRVAVAEWGQGYLELYPCFKYDISLHSILNSGNANNANLSLAISQRRIVFALDQNTGMFILNMFAYRNNWLHNN